MIRFLRSLFAPRAELQQIEAAKRELETARQRLVMDAIAASGGWTVPRNPRWLNGVLQIECDDESERAWHLSRMG